MIVAFDLDGTLCDNSAREAIAHKASAAAKRGEPSGQIWDEFHAAIPLDKPVPQVLETLDALACAGHDIEIWTARPYAYYDLTVEWMHKYEVSYSNLLMRAPGDWRKAYILKLEWFLQRPISERPHLVFEDHPETTRLLRLAGAVVAQVGEGHNA